MEELMDENAGKLVGGAVESNDALPQERARVNGAATVLQSGDRQEVDGPAAEFREAGCDGRPSSAEQRVVGD